ncbi:MAG: glycosyl hydrolase family 18 protein [Candidatus Cohnella colombiensis]|uniref:chitinase n=1 Tax=Candidatus Cohnella colombiensis TaxID=3121368 RepID=A0AA95EXW5_9BACL|nr:MAG: glycosyl hydrolase family 18 protein [Cohnella sp.]
MHILSRQKFTKILIFMVSFTLAFGTLLSAFKVNAADLVDLEAPQNLSVIESSITSNSANLNWDFDDDVYEIDVWNADTDVWMANINNWNLRVGSLLPETTYNVYITWWERPAPAANLRHKSNIVSFTTLAASDVIPTIGAPTNLSIAKDPVTEEPLITHNSATLAWDIVADFDNEFDVWNADTNAWMTWGNKTTHIVGGLVPETTYRIYITWNKDRPSLNFKSNIIEFTTKEDTSEYPDPPLTPPHNLRVTELTETTVKLGWTGSPGANGYDLYVNQAWKGGVWDGSNMATFTMPIETIAGDVYTFEVGAQNMPAVSANSNAVTITWGQLEAPEDLQVVTANRTTATLGWAPTPGATNYDIYKDAVKVATSSDNRYLATGLTEGQSYTFNVVATNSLWTSPVSSSMTVVPGSNYNIVTYFTAWSVYDRDFEPSDIDVSQITHINYAFADLCWRGYGTGATACQDVNIPLQKDYVFDGELVIGDHDVDIDNFAKLAERRDDNPNLKLMISVGGWSWSKNFSNLAATEETRRAFANSAVKFLRAYDLDGLDIDWEYPVAGGESYNSHRPEDKQNFTSLMQTVREALDAAGSEDGRYYLLSIASGQGDDFVVNADLAKSSQYLDYVSIMTYDYSGSWDVSAYHNAPLYYDKNSTSPSAARFHVNGGVTGHLNGGVPNYKLVMGLPFYGKGWTGCPPTGQYQLCEGGTVAEFGTWESRTFDFSDIEDNYLNQNGYVRYWNEAAKVPYLYNSELHTYISYNDEASMLYSTSYLRSLDLAGVMSWEISGDRNRTLSTQLVGNLPIDGTVNTSRVAAPHNLIIVSNGVNTIDVKWDASKDATGYDIFANRVWMGYTTKLEYQVTSLTPNTEYHLQVIAVKKADEQITDVSIASNELTVTTLSGLGSIILDSTSTLGDPTANQLRAILTNSGDKATVTLNTAEAILSITDNTSTKTQIVVKTVQRQVEAVISTEIIRAIVAKGNAAILSLVVNDVEYSIPIQALPLGDDIAHLMITIQTPEQEIIHQMKAKAEAIDAKVVVSPLEFKIEAVTSDGKSTEIQDFGAVYVSRIFSLGHVEIDMEQATGVMYIPETNEYRHVPTMFTVNADGTVTAELKRTGNSFYTIIESHHKFPDVKADWAKGEINSAVAKFIVSGMNNQQFGVDLAITRAEFVSIIVKALGLSPASESTSFKDVNKQMKYAEDVIAASKLGLIKGRSIELFDPDGSITRQEMAVIIANAMKFAGIADNANLSVLNRYEDQGKISSFAKASIALMVERKILLGISPSKFDPVSKVTRAQATVAVMRMLRALELTN